jgi:hypothetical protein
MKTLKVSLAIGQPVRRDGFACRDEGQRAKPLGSRMAMVNVVRELQSTGGEELSLRDASQFESLLAESFGRLTYFLFSQTIGGFR